jgi:hypothetical protein
MLDRLLAAFEVPVTEGGLLDTCEPGGVWYEKFAHPSNQQPKVLNGMLFSLLGLYEIADRTGSDCAAKLAERGAVSVVKMLHKFDLGDWSAYDILGKPASEHYHDIHVSQLRLLFEITGNSDFQNWCDRFGFYSRSVHSVEARSKYSGLWQRMRRRWLGWGRNRPAR